MLIEQLKIISETGRDAIRQLAGGLLERQEKMIHVNINAIWVLIKISGQQLKENCSDVSRIGPGKAWSQLMIDNIQRGTALNPSFMEITKHMQQEIAGVVEEQQQRKVIRGGQL